MTLTDTHRGCRSQAEQHAKLQRAPGISHPHKIKAIELSVLDFTLPRHWILKRGPMTSILPLLQAPESLEGQDEYDLFGITRSMDWLDADGQQTPRGASPKPEDADFGLRTGPLSRLYLDEISEEHHSCSETSIAPFHHLGTPSYMLSDASASGAVLPCGASPAAHLLGRNTSGAHATTARLWLCVAASCPELCLEIHSECG